MPLIILTALVQVGLIIHVVRTGRPPFWVFVILFVPGIGSIAYCIVELLPEISNSLTARRAMRGVRKTFDPGGDLRRRKLEHRLSGSVDPHPSPSHQFGNFLISIPNFRVILLRSIKDYGAKTQ